MAMGQRIRSEIQGDRQTAKNGKPAFQVGRTRPALLPKAIPASGSKYCPDITEGPARLPSAMPPNGSK
ncbi:hypothetical protein T10_11504 [Trichinella papuae]|uniref:Uncharacterized protein n=1 Tax=Trichinella papuae TaxID=268474 RepID=A0A0V1N5A3_9BILA|nr:hypothetical protein T10_11504 [Trichinella papuae]